MLNFGRFFKLPEEAQEFGPPKPFFLSRNLGKLYKAPSFEKAANRMATQIETTIMAGAFKFHHIGVAVAELDQAAKFYTSILGFRIISGPLEDPIQKVKACFLAEAEAGTIHLELIAPASDDSPIAGYLTKGIGAYHVCYEVADLGAALKKLRENGCLIVSKPVEAVAYGGRRIAWCFTPTNQLIELLEKVEKDAASKT